MTTHREYSDHCWHSLTSNELGTVSICCQCAPLWMTIVTRLNEEPSDILLKLQQEHPIYTFIVESPEEDDRAIEPNKGEKHLRVLSQ